MEEKQYINLKIEKEKDLYNSFDPEKNLSEDVKGAFLRWFEVSGSEMQVNPVHFAIISTLGTFSIWEGASVWIIRSPAHRRRRKIFKRLEEAADIEFVSADSMN